LDLVMTERPLDVLIVEDEVLLATELGFLLDEVGCHPVGHAMSSDEAVAMAADLHPDLALVDVHLRDGPTGVDVARRIHDDCGGVALFMTANIKRLPEDFAGACGVIGKPYSQHGVRTALVYLTVCLRKGQAPGPPPIGLELAPAYADRWGLNQLHPAA
jgi:CheY-like chemotaxis protein